MNTVATFLICLSGSFVLFTVSSARPTEKPNIIVIFTDDQGHADLGVQGQLKDIKTPNLDRMAAEGVRATAGYISAPQCSPSRAGLITGRYQQKFDFDHIPDGPLPLDQMTLADRLKPAGYVSGMVGKWHLEPNGVSYRWGKEHLPGVAVKPGQHLAIPAKDRLRYGPGERGFSEYFWGEMVNYWANYDLQGNLLKPEGEAVQDKRFRVDVQTDAALAFLKRNHEKPFFLYLNYYAPHVPLEATPEYLSRFPGEMPERRRYALAMMSAMDDGVGRILKKLVEYGVDEKTLVVFLSDNGAPLMQTMIDTKPIDTNGWDGSMNTPLVGEKGMLAEGGIRVPFLLRWKGTLPAGATYDKPIISLDLAATALAMAGLDRPAELDGVNLIPYLTKPDSAGPERELYWRFWSQSAVRDGKWKLLKASEEKTFLFDLESDAQETKDMKDEHPEIALQLEKKLEAWAQGLTPPGLPKTPLNVQEKNWYKYFFGVGGEQGFPQ